MRHTAVLQLVQAAEATRPPGGTEKKCLEAYKRVLRACDAPPSTSGWYMAENRARNAYRAALPLMTNQAAVRAFVSAVAQGVVLKVFDGQEASKLLYAAQVALAAMGKEKQCRKPQD